jgi:hypothetical protein
MDEATHEMMTKPRCGLKDKHKTEEIYIRRKRFTKLGEIYRTFDEAVCTFLYINMVTLHTDLGRLFLLSV